MRLADGAIVAGERIADVSLGMSRDKLISIIGRDFICESLPYCELISIENARFWITDDIITQILVFGDFCGLFMDCIGLGHTMSDVSQHFGQYQQELDTYILPEHPGICFELEDIDNWDEARAPIEYISIYK